MKVSFLGESGNPSFEGLTSIKNKLKNHLNKNGFEVVENQSNADIYHIHSGGFLPAFKHRRIADRCIYTLYSELNINPITNMTNLLEQIKFLKTSNIDPGRIKRFRKIALMSVISSLIPLFVKRFYLGKMNKLIVMTETSRKRLNTKNCHVIRIGIDTKKFKNINNPNKKLKVAYFGHSAVQKGFSDVVKAFENIEGINKALYFSNPTKLDAEDIEMEGHVKSIVEAYNSCSIIVLPYRTVNSAISNPLTLLEAMSCERAVITTNLTHIKEIVKDGAITINPYSPDKIEKEVKKLSANPKLRKELGKKARRIVVEHYSEEKMLKEYLSLYKEFI